MIGRSFLEFGINFQGYGAMTIPISKVDWIERDGSQKRL